MEKITASFKLPVSGVEPGRDGFAFVTNGSDLVAKLVFGSPFFGSKIKEVVLFAIQRIKPLVELVA